MSNRTYGCVAALVALVVTVGGAAPLGSAFTYQGILSDAGTPANGQFDLRFVLYDADVGGGQVGSPVLVDDLDVTDGRVTAQLDFGGVFDGTALWLQVSVRDGGSTGAYTVLSPRQELTAGPYALHALQAMSADQLAGQVPGYYLEWTNLTNVPAGFADGVDDDTTYSPGDGLSLVGDEFSVDGSVVRSDVLGDVTIDGDIRYSSPKTLYYSLPAAAFRPGKYEPSWPRPYIAHQDGYLYYLPADPNHSEPLVAPLHLPHGASITDFRCYTYDDDAAVDITASSFMALHRKELLDQSPTFIVPLGGNVDLSTTGQQSTLREHPIPLITSPDIDNSLYSYWVHGLFVTDTAGSFDVRFYGCKLTYQIETLNP
jgi:hypothetical protein